MAGLEDWPVPDTSTLSRRQKTVAIQVPFRRVAIGTVTADGAYDTHPCHAAIARRGGTAIILIRKNGRPWEEDCPAAQARNENLRASWHFGRAFWKRLTGYHARSRIEAQMRRLKALRERITHETPTARPPKSTRISPS